MNINRVLCCILMITLAHICGEFNGKKDLVNKLCLKHQYDFCVKNKKVYILKEGFLDVNN